MSIECGKHNTDSVSFQNLWPGLFLNRSAVVYPNKDAVVYGELSYSYAEFDERVRHLAGALANAGINALIYCAKILSMRREISARRLRSPPRTSALSQPLV